MLSVMAAHQAEGYFYRKYADEIDEILKHLISHGKGLEMNMAGMKYGLGFPNPHPDVIRRYKSLVVKLSQLVQMHTVRNMSLLTLTRLARYL